eukprot:TRINITY_DN1784_c0_g2_i1.p1 TRINITY_DN1784_c0_g2~~TRINITY_DN1784_c0_g2_i1.p1  ORF type:complete len:461 (+),score=87.36 TRINITY_DN1784_c0_g2_i1:59-1384(+)
MKVSPILMWFILIYFFIMTSILLYFIMFYNNEGNTVIGADMELKSYPMKNRKGIRIEPSKKFKHLDWRRAAPRKQETPDPDTDPYANPSQEIKKKKTKRTIINPEILSDDYKVDIVYTWVNGSDPLFLKNLNEALKTHKNLNENEYKSARYNNRDELKYSLRSVEKYFDWYNNIYIVTNGQIPSWLNTSHPRIKVITHQEIFLNKKDLPTFSSVAIESHIHRIPGLSEEFIYLNDDIMFADHIKKDDFVSKHGYLKVYGCWESPRGSENSKSDNFGNSMRYVNRLYDYYFGFKMRQVICHTPHFLKKSVINDLQYAFVEEYKKTSSHKFRANDDMQFAFSYFHFLIWQKKYLYIDYNPGQQLIFSGIKIIGENKKKFEERISQNDYKFVCIQDDLSYKDDPSDYQEYIEKFYNSKFPSPSQFELADGHHNSHLYINETITI